MASPPDMVEIRCEDCSESLGYQQADTPVVREMWRHNGCPVRIARKLGLTRQHYEDAWGIATVAIAGALPDFPNGYLDTSEKAADIRTYRARIAARCALESLSAVGFTMSREATDG